MNKPIRNISNGKFRRRIINRTIPSEDFLSTQNKDNRDNDISTKNIEQMFNKNQIIEIYERSKIDYIKLKDELEFNMVNTEPVDVSIIIPVMGRKDFNLPLVKHLNDAIKNFSDKSYSITFVEHSEEPIHREMCKDVTNHIWIKKNSNSFFNKCLAMNIGALFSNRANYYLFHDIDLLVDRDFFSGIFDNLSRIPHTSALQAFGGRKVVVMNKNLTDLIINNRVSIDDVRPGDQSSPYSTPGAPGGSIFINSKSFYDIGGFDAEFFHSYSCEDAFFYHKAEVTIGIHGCDIPLVDVFHMDHPRTNGSDNPDRHKQNLIYSGFISMSQEDKFNFITHISNNLKMIR